MVGCCGGGGGGACGAGLVFAIIRTVFLSAWRLLQNQILTTSRSYPSCSAKAVISAPRVEKINSISIIIFLV